MEQYRQQQHLFQEGYDCEQPWDTREENQHTSPEAETAPEIEEMADDMGASLEDVLSSIAEDSVIDLKRLQDDLGIVIIPEKCSKQDLINSLN